MTTPENDSGPVSARGTRRIDPWRTLAHDGARRQEVRSICRDPFLIDYAYASWGEYLLLDLVAEAIGEWASK